MSTRTAAQDRQDVLDLCAGNISQLKSGPRGPHDGILYIYRPTGCHGENCKIIWWQNPNQSDYLQIGQQESIILKMRVGKSYVSFTDYW